MRSPGPLEALHVEKLTKRLIDEARADMLAGGPSLRAVVWGIQVERKTPGLLPEQRRIRFPHYQPPKNVYLEARLCVVARYRGQTEPFRLSIIDDALAQLTVWRVFARSGVESVK